MTPNPAPPRGENPLAFARFHARGQVQGVGFRPFIHRLALRHGLKGSVWNHTGGVTVEAWGTHEDLTAFQMAVPRELPPLAALEAWEREADTGTRPPPAEPPVTGAPGPPPAEFRIVGSRQTGEAHARRVAPDTAPCPECLDELRDPSDRRHDHAFVNCTNCGPRFTLVRDLPYDRPNTSMAAFPMCPACAREYEDPSDRRFHAQPVCCPDCGPRLAFVPGTDRASWEVTPGGAAPGDVTPGGAAGPAADSDAGALARGVAVLHSGGILAVKGVGGYHLAVDATDAQAVARLRARKGRDAKPFAVMVRDLDAAERLVELTPRGAALVQGPAAPIVLAPWAHDPDPSLAPGVAPELDRLGVMLPSSPLHHLLLAAVDRPLVMTSGNRTDDPLAREDDEALERLGDIADGFLVHDRPIVRAVDDSVLMDTRNGAPLPLRYARGYVPASLRLPSNLRLPAGAGHGDTPSGPGGRGDGLCMGGDLKGALALVREGGTVVLGHHLGDLGHVEALRRARTTARDLVRLFDAAPVWIAVDPHPGYLSHRLGRELARELGTVDGPVDVVEVQHHHAHLASLLAEHGVEGPVVGIVADGVGYGADGSAWGGEVLVGDLREVRRAGHLRPLRLPGGDAAARETGRCALSWLVDLLGVEAARSSTAARQALPEEDVRQGVLGMLERDFRCPPSTGAGRLFDAAAALLGVCPRNRYEAESGQRLEALARRSVVRPEGTAVVEIQAASDPFEMDHRPLLRELLRGLEEGYLHSDLAWFFHDAVADALARGALRATREAGLGIVGLSGGVFCNELLAGQVQRKLEAHGLQVLTHRRVPPNDGGIALGQAAVAAARGRSATD